MRSFHTCFPRMSHKTFFCSLAAPPFARRIGFSRQAAADGAVHGATSRHPTPQTHVTKNRGTITFGDLRSSILGDPRASFFRRSVENVRIRDFCRRGRFFAAILAALSGGMTASAFHDVAACGRLLGAGLFVTVSVEAREEGKRRDLSGRGSWGDPEQVSASKGSSADGLRDVRHTNQRCRRATSEREGGGVGEGRFLRV
ncbi:hypothetical protein ACFLQR_03095 [Verrucomicrobiota bacterium]